MAVSVSQKYAPTPPPVGADVPALARWMHAELVRIASAYEAHEATTVSYGKEYRNVADSAALTISWRNGQKQRVELSSSCTLTFSPPNGVCNLMLRLVQDSTGGRVVTLPSTMKWQGGTTPTWVTTANAVNVIAMYFDGTNYHATASVDSK